MSAMLTRKTPLLRRPDGAARLSVPVFRPKRCDARKGGCGLHFTPSRAMQTACGPACAQRQVEYAKAKREAAAAADDRRKTRAAKEALKTLAQLRAEAQVALNAYVRARDKAAGHDCICCGAPLDWHSTLPGGAIDAGHYLSRGSAPELALDERNVNAQRKGCNRPGGATRARFRAGMVARWGEAAVAELEGPHPARKWTHDELRAIRTKYRAFARELST